MNNLIKITKQTIGDDEVNAVNARDLHDFLESKQDFSTWIKNRIKQYGFLQDTDFIKFHNSVEQVSGTKARIDYALSIDMAKELSMVERTEKGKKARQYFIEMERQSRKVLTPAEQLLENAKRLVAHEKELAVINARQDTLEREQFETKVQVAALVEGEGYYTIVGYCNLHNKKVDSKSAAALGKRASDLCKSQDILIGNASHPLYGKVNTYPKEILERIIN